MARMLTSAHPETVSFGPGLRSRFSAILGIGARYACLPRRSGRSYWGGCRKRSGLVLNQNLPFLDGH